MMNGLGAYLVALVGNADSETEGIQSECGLATKIVLDDEREFRVLDIALERISRKL